MAYLDRDASGQVIGPIITPMLREPELFDTSSIVLASAAALCREEEAKRVQELDVMTVGAQR